MSGRLKLCVLAAVVCLCVGIGVSLRSGGQDTPASVRIAALLPMTGTAANYGLLMSRGVSMAVDEYKALGTPVSRDVDVIIEDSKSVPKDGVLAMRKLLDVDRVVAVMPALSGIILACVPLTEKDHVVLLNCPANSPKLRKAGRFVFNLYLLSDQESSALASYAVNTMHARTAAVVFANNESGRSYKESFAGSFQSLGGSIVAAEGHEQGCTDFRTTIEKLRALKPDLVFIASYYAESALFLRQANDLAYKAKWLSYSSVETPDFLKLAGSAADGLVYSQPGLDLSDSEVVTAKFVAEYRRRFSQDPDLWSAQYYDGARLLLASISSGARTADGMRSFLATVKDFPGVTGRITFNDTGCVDRTVRFKTVRGGRFLSLSR